MNKTVIYLLIAVGLGVAAYFGWDFWQKKKKAAETAQRILASPALRAEAEQRAARTKTSLTDAAMSMAKSIN